MTNNKAFKRGLKAGAICIICLSTLLAGAHAQTVSDSPNNAANADKDKFALLGLVGLVSPTISMFQAMANWVGNRIQGSNPANAGASQSGAVPLALAPMSQGQAMAPVQYTQSMSFNPAPLIMGQPDIPLSLQQAAFDPGKPWDRKANYQGISVSAVMLDGQNRIVETRSLASPFRTGERFKLRLVSTSDALVSIDALKAAPGSIGANGTFNAPPVWAGQLYPARADQVAQIKAGDVVYLPLGANEYFTFDGQAGIDLLSLNMRHPQAGNQRLNLQPVYRQDSQGMTVYSQLSQEGTVFALTQVLALQHNR